MVIAIDAVSIGRFPRPRQGYWDAWKGLAIIAVIVIHTCVITTLAPESTGARLTVVVRQFVNFAVPTFLALSGLMAGLSKRPKDGAYVLQRIKSLWPAYLVWTFFYILAFARGHLADPVALILDVFAGQGIGIGYYVIVLTQMIILTPLLSRVQSLTAHIVAMVVLTIIGRAFTYYAALGPHPFGFPFNGLPFFVWYPFFHLGFVIGTRVDLDVSRAKLRTLAALAAFAALLASVVEGFIWLPVDPALAISQIKITTVFFSFALFLWCTLAYSALKDSMPEMLSWIGRNSYVIYLAHLIPLRIVGGLATRVGMDVGTPAYILSVSLLVVLICLAGVVAARRLVPKSWQPYIIG